MSEDILKSLSADDISVPGQPKPEAAGGGSEYSATPLGGGRNRFDIFADDITIPEILEIKAQPAPKAEAQPEPKPEPKAEIKAPIQAEVKPEPKPMIKIEPKPAVSTPAPVKSQETAATPIEIKAKPAEAPAPALEPTMPAYVEEVKELRIGDVIKGRVVKVEKSGVFVDIGYKSEGFIGLDELILHQGEEVENIYPVGQEVDVLIMKLETKEGQVQLSQKKAAYEVSWKTAYQAFKDRSILEAYVISGVRGGLVVDHNGLRGFIPASQMARGVEGPLENLVGQKIPIKVIEIDRKKKKVVFSHRQAADESKRLLSRKLLEELEVGQVRQGKVTSIKDFGVFVDLGGLEGLVHVSEMAWARPNHPSEMVSLGQEVDVFVLGVDQETGKIALGMKQLEQDPWVEAKNLYKVGQTVEGMVSRLVKFGAFVTLGKGLEGLVHLTELADPAPAKPEEIVKPGQKIRAKVLRVIPEEQKIGLSLKAARKEEEAAVRKAETTTYTSESGPRATLGDLMKEKGIIEELKSAGEAAAEPAPEAPPAP